MKTKASRYFQNIGFEPVSAKVFTLDRKDTKEYIRSLAYVFLFEDNDRRKLLSIQSKKDPINLKLENIQKVEKSGKSILFEYQGIKYGIETNLEGQESLNKILKGKDVERVIREPQEKPGRRIEEKIEQSPAIRVEKPPVAPSSEPIQPAPRPLTFVERMHLAANKTYVPPRRIAPQPEPQPRLPSTPKKVPQVTKKQQETLNKPTPQLRSTVRKQKTSLRNMYVNSTYSLIPNNFQDNHNPIQCILGNGDILLEFTNTFVKLYGIKNDKQMKLVHCSNYNTKSISKAIPLHHSQYVALLKYNNPSTIFLYDITSKRELIVDLNKRYSVNQPIIDIIQSIEVHTAKFLVITTENSYILTVKDIDEEAEIAEFRKLRSKKCQYAVNHSLGGYMAVAQNNEFWLYKLLTAEIPFTTGKLPEGAHNVSYSKNFILYLVKKQVEIILFDNVNKEVVNFIWMEPTNQDKAKYGIDNQPFSMTTFTTNRKYVVAALKNLLFIWKLDDLLKDEIVYELSEYGSTIVGIKSFSKKSNEELLWVTLSNGQSIEILEV